LTNADYVLLFLPFFIATMILKEAPPDKLYFSIGEVSEIFAVNPSLIRFWEKEFDILKPKKNRKGNRLYSQKDLENLKNIYILVKERGFTLEGARKKLKEKTTDTDTTGEVIARLKNVKEHLLKLSEEI
jgi:DNA-binding transcriptional MerR regulator